MFYNFISCTSIAVFLTFTPLHGGQLQEPAQTGELAVLESNNFNEIPQNGIVVVDYYANWCGPCRRMLPKFATVAGIMKGDVQFFKCEATDEVFEGLQIKTIPCIVLYKDGKEMKRTGSMSEGALKDWIAAELTSQPE